MKMKSCVLVLLMVLCGAASVGAMEITAITVFGCNGEGTQDGHSKWNSGPLDGPWDLFFYEGDLVKNAGQVKWLNNQGDHTFKIAPTEGSVTYTFHFDSDSEVHTFGLNLFSDGSGTPILSVFAPVSGDAAKPAKFQANRSGNTMGWPMSEVPGAGTLVFEGINGSLWNYEEAAAGQKITITDFKVFTPAAAGKLDLVGPGETTPSGQADYVGQITLKTEKVSPAPQDWLLWASTVAEIQIGSNNKDGSWKEKFDYQKANPPFSFTLGGKSSNELLKSWKFNAEHKKGQQGRVTHSLTWTDPKTSLEVRWEGVEYSDFNTLEWTVYLTNTGYQDTPMVENLKALDADFVRKPGREYRLHHWSGTFVTADDFATKSTVLDGGKEMKFLPAGGRTTGAEWPYYNLETGDEGIIIVVSWAGRWYADFQRQDTIGLKVTAGQETTHFKLQPGEMIRTPMIVMQFWKGGDWNDAQNTWRQWMVKHNVPRPGGKLPPLPMLVACSSHQFAEMTKANEKNQIEFIDSYLNKGLKLDYWWMDAGWYVGAAEKGWPWTGTWEVDRSPNRFPNGLRAISDHAHSKGVKIIVWFEPERVAGGTWLTTEHPEWVIGGAGGGLLNLGHPEALKWAIAHFGKLIADEGIDLYRQDYNIDPLGHWRSNDTEDRQGITENKYVMGYLAYWDGLLAQHPDMLIDSCASGGHRLDLETMRRAVTLLRSDYLTEPVGQQGHTYGLSFWLPFHGTVYNPPNAGGWGWGANQGEKSYSPYVRRSNMCPSGNAVFDFRVEVNDALIQKLYKEWLEVGKYYFGDYYPLTPYNLAPDEWLGWQFHEPSKGEGFVQAFRRDDCIYKSAELRLRGLDPQTTYQLKNYDEKELIRATGAELMDRGILVDIPERPGAATIRYQKANRAG